MHNTKWNCKELLLCKSHVTLYYLLFYVVHIVHNTLVLCYVTYSPTVENNACTQ